MSLLSSIVLRLRRSILTLVVGMAAPMWTHADYGVDLSSDGLPARTVKVGESFNLDVTLSSTGSDQHWAATLRIEFTSSGLRLDRYEWSFPFLTGGGDDTSVPAFGSLPEVIRADSAPDGPGTSNRVDVFLSNFTPAVQGYRNGRLLRLQLAVPADYVGADSIAVKVIPESFGDGFSAVPARAGEPFRLRIAPAEGQPSSPLSVELEQGWISLTWPAAIRGAILQTTTNLGDDWVDFPETPQLVGDRNRVQIFAGTAARPVLFRLRFP